MTMRARPATLSKRSPSSSIRSSLHREEPSTELEKCGNSPLRMLVARPYRVRLGSDRVIKMTVHPTERTIRTEDLDTTEMVFSGSTAYGIDHEMEHLAGREIRGEGLRVFRWNS